MIRPIQRHKRGFVLLATAASVIVLFGLLGLAVDLGRIYIVKNEAQAFADFASVAAARKLDGTASGITAAKAEVTNSTNKYNFGSQGFGTANVGSGPVVQFATKSSTNATTCPTDDASYSVTPSPATNYACVRVTASPSVNLSFMPYLPGMGYTQTVKGQAIAGVVPQSFPLGGYMPFTPFAHDPTNANGNYGYAIGEEYGFRWPGNVNSRNNACHGDTVNLSEVDNWPTYNFSDQVAGSTRGYFELQSASAIADAILGGKQTLALAVGDILNMTNGNKQSESNALELRASYDTDLTAYTYNTTGTKPAYAGNGMRMVIMPVNSGPTGTPAYAVLGFGSFLLPITYPNGGNKTWCAIYMGSSTLRRERRSI